MDLSALSLVLTALWHGLVAHLCDYASDVSVQRNAYLQISHLDLFLGLGVSMCERKCSNVTGSRSYNYFRPDGKCKCLGESSATSGQALVAREGWHHGDLDAAQGIPNNSCVCPDGRSCDLDLPALLRCPMRCPLPPPPLGNADVHATNSTTALYVCREDFTFFGSSDHVTCADGGTWEGLGGTCKRTTWTNVTLSPGVIAAMEWMEPIPGPVGPGWTVEVIGTPTKPTRSSVILLSGNDIILGMDMRISYGALTQVTLLVARIGGSWFGETRFSNAPWETGVAYNVTVVIDSANSAFEIHTNGFFLSTYPCSGSCSSLTHLLLGDDVAVHSVQMIFP